MARGLHRTSRAAEGSGGVLNFGPKLLAIRCWDPRCGTRLQSTRHRTPRQIRICVQSHGRCLDSVPTNRSFGEGRSAVDNANPLEGSIDWNSMAPSSSRERLQSGATRRSARVSRWVGPTQAVRWRPVSRAGVALSQKFNAPVVLQTDRARAKTRKQDTTRPRNRFLPDADSQLCHR